MLQQFLYPISVLDTPEMRDRLPDIEMNLRTVGAGMPGQHNLNYRPLPALHNQV